MSKTKIEWTEVTWNPVLGCSKVSEGCRNCYAMTMSSRIANAAREKKNPSPVEKGYMKVVPQDKDGKFLPKWNNKIALIEERLEDPLRWQKPRMVFVNSMSDLFHPDVPFEFVVRVFDVMSISKEHTFQILTKRPERMSQFFEWIEQERVKNEYAYPEYKPLLNVWLGTSVENQETADLRIPHLLKCPAAVRFLSCEPLVGAVDLSWIHCKYLSDDPSVNYFNALDGNIFDEDYEDWINDARPFDRGIDWVIVGGESGPNARPMHPDWARSLRDQCVEAGVAYFFKQWGEYRPNYGYKNRFAVEWDNGEYSHKVGKKQAGRLLDGREWNQMPGVRS